MGCVSLLAACGGDGGIDAGGFTSSLRHSAQTALNDLQFSPVPTTLTQIAATSQVLQECTVHVMSSHPLVFRLFMDWYPASSGQSVAVGASVYERRIRFTWLQAEIPAGGGNPSFSFGQVPADIPIAQATHRLESHYGSALQAPFEDCELLPNGTIYGYPYGSLTTPISTSTVPISTAPTPTTP